MLLHSSRLATVVNKEAGMGGAILKGVKSFGKRLSSDAGGFAKSVSNKGLVGPLPKGQGRGLAGWKPSTIVGKAAKTTGRVGTWAAKNPGKAIGVGAAGATLGAGGVEVGKQVIQSSKTPDAQALMQRRMQGFK